MLRARICCVALVLAACDAPAPAPAADTSQASAPAKTTEPAPPVASSAPPPAATPATQTPSASASVSASASAPAPTRPAKPTCAKGSYEHESPKFCILMPDGYAPSSAKMSGVMDGLTFRSNAPGTMDFQVTWIKKERSIYVEERNKLKEAAKEDPNAHVGKTRDGRGVYVRFVRDIGGQKVLSSQSVSYRKGHIFWCKAQAFEKPKPPRGFLTTCQTLLAR